MASNVAAVFKKSEKCNAANSTGVDAARHSLQVQNVYGYAIRP